MRRRSWGDYFNGFKDENPWVAHVPLERLPKERRSIGIFGLEIAQRERQIDLGRPFMPRFGDIGRIEAQTSAPASSTATPPTVSLSSRREGAPHH